MNQPRIRRLAAVWFADVVGYTSLSAKDEDAALAVIDELQTCSRRSTQDRGRIVKFMGDGVLAVFDSANDALLSATELEESFANADVVREHGCSLSVGVHLGEVVEAEDGDIYGDGVNVAARIEELAGSRQILMSEDVYRQIRNRPTFKTHSFGQHQMKGLDGPMTLYALGEGQETEVNVMAKTVMAKTADGGGTTLVADGGRATLVNRGAGAPVDSDATAVASSRDPSGQPPSEDGEWRPFAMDTVLSGRYTLKSLLGRGGFGATYRASDRGRFGSHCAIKEFAPRSAEDPNALARFKREALALVDLSHEGIPRMHEFFEDQGRYFLVQDLAEGEDLSSIVAMRGPMSEAKTVSILNQLLDVLDYLHGHDPPIVHRDVKPANIILADDNRVQLVDFGAVRDAEPGDATVSAIYTPGYAPLQQLMGKVSPSADLFAAGATAAFLLTGTPPTEFYDIANDAMSVRGRTGASDHLEGVIEGLTNGASGYASAAEAKRALAETDGVSTTTDSSEPGVDTGGGDATIALSPDAARALVRAAGRVTSPAPPGPATPVAANAHPPARRSRGKYVVGAGVVVGLAALGLTVMSEPELDDAGSDGGAVITEAAVGVVGNAGTEPLGEPLPLDAIARATTDADLLIQIRHPVTWPIVSQPTDRHVAVRDPVTGALFLAGIDVVGGLDVPARVFVDRWAATTLAPYAQVAVVSSEPPTGGTFAYRLDVIQASQAVREGVVVITPLTEVEQGQTIFRWWAALNQSEATAATFQAMAESVEVGLVDGA